MYNCIQFSSPLFQFSCSVFHAFFTESMNLSDIEPLWCRINARGAGRCDSLATFFHRFPIFAFHAGRRGEHCGSGSGRRWEGRKGLIRPRASPPPPTITRVKASTKKGLSWGRKYEAFEGKERQFWGIVHSSSVCVKLRIEDRSKSSPSAPCRICSESLACSFGK